MSEFLWPFIRKYFFDDWKGVSLFLPKVSEQWIELVPSSIALSHLFAFNALSAERFRRHCFIIFIIFPSLLMSSKIRHYEWDYWSLNLPILILDIKKPRNQRVYRLWLIWWDMIFQIERLRKEGSEMLRRERENIEREIHRKRDAFMAAATSSSDGHFRFFFLFKLWGYYFYLFVFSFWKF